MKAFKISVAVLSMLFGILGAAAQCASENVALKQECENKVKKAAELIKKIGPEAAFHIITDPSGPFVDKNSHVFCIDINSGTVLAHKFSLAVGFNMRHYKDAQQGTPYTAILNLAPKKEKGWFTYTSYGTGPERRDTPALKYMHYYRVAGTDILLCCGYWEDA